MVSSTDSFATYVANLILETAEQNEISHNEAWPIVAANLLGYNTDDIDFLNADEVGINFFIEGSSVYEIFRVKMHELGEFLEPQHILGFDDSGTRDLEKARKFLLESKSVPPNIDKRLLGLRERIRDDCAMIEDSVDEYGNMSCITLIFHLVTLGDNFTSRAKDAVEQFKMQLAQYEEKNLGIELRFEHHGINSLSEFHDEKLIESRPEMIVLGLANTQLGFNTPKEVEIRSNKFVTFYAPAIDLVKSARNFGPRLFDANVRYELKRSAINQVIANSATHAKTIKLFHLYNNGITIAAKGWSYKKEGKEIEIREPSIINGCQTVRSLAEAEKQLRSIESTKPDLLQLFEDKCSVLVRLVNNGSVQIEDVVRAANTQNAMEPRNLLSNQPEQRKLESELASLGWFLERKDGALDALKESGCSSLGTSISKFQVNKAKRGQKKIRYFSNKELAATWLSFIGYSDEGKNKKKKHFDETRDGLYKKCFQQTPKLHRHVAQINGNAKEIFQFGRPPAPWMLVSLFIFRIVSHIMPSANQIRGQLRKDMRAAGDTPTLALVNEKIMEDEYLRLSYALSMADHILVELVGYVIARALGEAWLSPGPARKILNLGVVGELYETNQFPESLASGCLLSLSKEQVSQDPALLLIRFAAYGFEKTLSDPVEEKAFVRSERKSRYIQSEALLRKYPKTIDNYEAYLSRPANFAEWWDEGSIYERIKRLLR